MLVGVRSAAPAQGSCGGAAGGVSVSGGGGGAVSGLYSPLLSDAGSTASLVLRVDVDRVSPTSPVLNMVSGDLTLQREEFEDVFGKVALTATDRGGGGDRDAVVGQRGARTVVVSFFGDRVQLQQQQRGGGGDDAGELRGNKHVRV